MPYDKTNRGSLWHHADKKSDKHPDYTGEVNLEGRDYQLSIWKKNAHDHPNAPTISFSLTRKEDQTRPQNQQNSSPKGADGAFDDEIPF